MTMQKLWTQIKRELWEHKVGLLWTPAAVALLLMLSFLYMIVTHGYGEHALVGDFDSMHKMEFSDNNSASGEPDEPSETTQSSQDLVDSFMVLGVYALNVVLWLPLAIVLLVYAHGTLFDDRKNREILFWRSMPVSETQNVLTKFFVIGVIAPTIVFLLTFVCMIDCVHSTFLLILIFVYFLLLVVGGNALDNAIAHNNTRDLVRQILFRLYLE